jgi:hypothetical protein
MSRELVLQAALAFAKIGDSHVMQAFFRRVWPPGLYV